MIGWKGVFLVLTVLGLGRIGFRIHTRYFSNEAEITVWDVGQGDSILLQLPRGRNFLIDTGGGSRNELLGEELVRELSRKGILKLNGLLVSHPDADHLEGAFPLLRKIKIEKIGFSAPLLGLPAAELRLNRLLAEAQSRGIPITPISESVQVPIGPAQLRLTPSLPNQVLTPNNLGLITELEVYGCRFLFPGDIEKEAEAVYSNSSNLPVTVLKVAHHGSRTSSRREFLERFRPQVAVISVGADNRYGHPRHEVIARLRHYHTQVFRTDFHGYVSFRVLPKGEVHCQSAQGTCGKFQCAP